jgi:hypothetical protein
MGNAISTHQADVIDVYRKLLRMGNKAKVKSERNKKARGIKYLFTIRKNYNDLVKKPTTRTRIANAS